MLEVLLVVSCHRLFPLAKSHSSDLEPYASPGLSECERRNPEPAMLGFSETPTELGFQGLGVSADVTMHSAAITAQARGFGWAWRTLNLGGTVGY